MLLNLKKEMWKAGITGVKIASLLDIDTSTFSIKLNGKRDFTRSEMFLIWRTYFSDMDMAYLFEEN